MIGNVRRTCSSVPINRAIGHQEAELATEFEVAVVKLFVVLVKLLKDKGQLLGQKYANAHSDPAAAKIYSTI